jgi:hypothetical protein
MLVHALDGAGREAIVDGEPLELLAGEPLHPEVAAVVDGSFLDREPPDIRGGGYVVDALEAACGRCGRPPPSRRASWPR